MDSGAEHFYNSSTSELVASLQEFKHGNPVCFTHDVKQADKFPESVCLMQGEEKVCYHPLVNNNDIIGKINYVLLAMLIFGVAKQVDTIIKSHALNKALEHTLNRLQNT